MGVIDTVFRQRARASGLSVWELGDLLGIHPHQIGSTGQRLEHLPCAVIIDLARRLDMHPADLVDGLDSVLANTRGSTTQPVATEDTMATAAGPLPHTVATANADDRSAPTPDDDAAVVLTALAHAIEPLTIDELATALGWSLRRVAASLDHVQRHPHIGGPVTLRRTAPGTYTVTARLDRLTPAQRHHLGEVHRARHPLNPELADTLLAVLALRCAPEDYLTHRLGHLDAERELKRDGLIHAEHGPHRPEAHADVLYSLRYWNTPQDH